MKLSEFCKNKRLKSGDNVNRFSLDMGKSRTFVANVEKGDYDVNPSIKRLKTVATAYNMTKEDLMLIDDLDLTDSEIDYVLFKENGKKSKISKTELDDAIAFRNEELKKYFEGYRLVKLDEDSLQKEKVDLIKKRDIFVIQYLVPRKYSIVSRVSDIFSENNEDILCKTDNGNKAYVCFFEEHADANSWRYANKNSMRKYDNFMEGLLLELMLGKDFHDAYQDEYILAVNTPNVFNYICSNYSYSVQNYFIKIKVVLVEDGQISECIINDMVKDETENDH